MEKNKNKILGILLSTIQYLLLICGSVCAVLGISLSDGNITAVGIILILSITVIDVIRRFLGLNLFLAPKDTSHQTLILIFRFVGLGSIVLLLYGFSLQSGMIISIAIVTLLSSFALVYTTRYGIWNLYAKAKDLDEDYMKLKIIIFFSIFFAIIVALLLFIDYQLDIVIISFYLLISWFFASFILGFYVSYSLIDIIKESLIEESQKKRAIFAALIFKMFKGSSANNDMTVINKIFSYYSIIVSAPLIGNMLVFYYMYALVTKKGRENDYTKLS